MKISTIVLKIKKWVLNTLYAFSCILIVSTNRQKKSFYFNLPKKFFFFILLGSFLILLFSCFFAIDRIYLHIKLVDLKKNVIIKKKLAIFYEEEFNYYYKNVYFRFTNKLEKLASKVGKKRVDSKKKGGIGGIDFTVENLPKEFENLFQKKSSLEASDFLLKKKLKNNVLADDSEYLNNFFQRRKQFIKFVPTLWPIESHLGALRKIAGSKKLFIQSVVGLKVLATASGTIKKIVLNDENKFFSVMIDHSYGYETRYEGLLSVDVSHYKEGDFISKGNYFGISSGDFYYSVKLANAYQNAKDYLIIDY